MTKEEAQAILKDAFARLYAANYGVQSLVEQFDPILSAGDLEIYEGYPRRLVPCRTCSEAGGAGRVIEHLEPACDDEPTPGVRTSDTVIPFWQIFGTDEESR